MIKGLLTLYFLFFLGSGVYSHEQGVTKVDIPIYEGGFYGGFTWLYLQPTVSDGDLQFGTALTLTGPPLVVADNQNLNAHVLQIKPDYTSAYRFNLGYVFPCTSFNMDLDYFYFRASDSDSATSPVRNPDTYQFLQNFLGGGFVSSNANDTQRIDQVDLAFGQPYILDNCLNLYPYVGMSFAYIKRNFDVEFTDFVAPPIINPIPALLVGSLRSRYWGLGLSIGSNFSFPLFSCLEFVGNLGLSALGGNISSEIDSNSVRENLIQNFNAKDSSFRVVPIVRSDLGLLYTYPFCNNKLALAFSVGYQTDYYFRAVDRVNPFNGYVNNANSFPKTTTSSIGLGGPYAQIMLTTLSQSCSVKSVIHSISPNPYPACGFYLSVENGWLEPCPTSKDLAYATLIFSDGSSENQEIVPDHSWSGRYRLGYAFLCNLNLEASYRYFQNRASDSVTAGPSENITSLNASGLSSVVFSNASSRVRYQLHQLDLSAGKYARLCSPFDLYGFVGLRYLNLQRTLHNAYTGGVPPNITESKFPVLASKYWGVGPLMGMKPFCFLYDNLGLTGLFDIALLVGSSKATLDQLNLGELSEDTSNDLSTRHIPTIVPVVDTKIGMFWTFECGNRFAFAVEGGYLFSYYYKAINLVFPNLLTGLGQNNSNLLLSGPYLTLNVGF